VDEPSAHAPRGSLAALAIGTLGVVYGDIGASPLYAIDQIFLGPAGVAPTPDNVLGAISLAIWTITLIVAVKYALLVLRAETDGEGGTAGFPGSHRRAAQCSRRFGRHRRPSKEAAIVKDRFGSIPAVRLRISE
jgi:K+ transporter